ncbi:hypothetical protein D3C79_771950 [compost metagenome]
MLLQHVLGHLEAVILQPVGGFAIDDHHPGGLGQFDIEAIGAGLLGGVAKRSLQQADLRIAAGKLHYLAGQLGSGGGVISGDVGVTLDVLREVIDAHHRYTLLLGQAHWHCGGSGTGGGVQQHVDAFAQQVLDLADLAGGVCLCIDNQHLADAILFCLLQHPITHHQVELPLQAGDRHTDFQRFAFSTGQGGQ